VIGVVTGLLAEARLARPLGRAVAGGGDPDGAARAAARLADDGATALLSFGLAGGLDAAIRPGTILVPVSVRTAGRSYETDLALNLWLGGAAGTLFAAERVVASRAQKRVLRDTTGADAVDLESGAVAEIARCRGLPFAVLRAICDPAEGDLPAAALVALDGGGAIGLARVLGSVARHPGQIAALLRLAGQAAAARQALARRVGLLGIPAGTG
jgi:adenosylhomocysteine nucleosidase